MRWTGRRFRDEPSSEVPATERGARLCARYGIGAPALSRATLDESLGVLDLLDRLSEKSDPFGRLRGLEPGRTLPSLDIGAKNWRYLHGLSAWIAHQGLRVGMAGVELDAYRVYADLTTRFSVGMHFAEACSRARAPSFYEYVPGDVRDWKAPAHLITWLFPFVSRDPHRAWGLSAGSFDPAGLFARVEGLLERGGVLVMANQGEWEWDISRRLFRELKASDPLVVTGSLHASTHPIFLTAWTREA